MTFNAHVSVFSLCGPPLSSLVMPLSHPNNDDILCSCDPVAEVKLVVVRQYRNIGLVGCPVGRHICMYIDV